MVARRSDRVEFPEIGFEEVEAAMQMATVEFARLRAVLRPNNEEQFVLPSSRSDAWQHIHELGYGDEWRQIVLAGQKAGKAPDEIILDFLDIVQPDFSEDEAMLAFSSMGGLVDFDDEYDPVQASLDAVAPEEV